MNQKRVYRAADIAAMRGCSKSTVWRDSAAGQMPKPFKLSPGQTVWDAQEIEDWYEAKKAARFIAPVVPTPIVLIQRGRNPVAASSRPDAKRPGRPKNAKQEAQVTA